MQNLSNQPQSPNESAWEQGYGPAPSPESREDTDPQAGSQQHPYPPEQSRPLYNQGQQHRYRNWPPSSAWATGDASSFERSSLGLKARTAGVLCYLFGWVGGLVFLLLERDSHFVRFHAMQSILFFGTMSILGWICSFFPFALFGLGGIVGLVGFIGWIVLMVVAYQGRYYKLPVFGDIAEQLVNRASF